VISAAISTESVDPFESELFFLRLSDKKEEKREEKEEE